MSTVDAAAAKAPTGLWFKRIHSLVGIVPLGAFILFHFWFHSSSWQGAAVYDQRLSTYYSLPLRTTLSILFIYLPLIYHSIYGLVLTKRDHPIFLAYGILRNWAYVL